VHSRGVDNQCMELWWKLCRILPRGTGVSVGENREAVGGRTERWLEELGFKNWRQYSITHSCSLLSLLLLNCSVVFLIFCWHGLQHG
jgi:hypothetical protein